MSSKKNDRWKLRVLHIRESAQNILTYTKGLTFDEFLEKGLVYNAVMRCFQIIGEASKNIPDDIKNQYKDIPWKETAQLRDKVTHDYDGLNDIIIWDVISNHLPKFLEQINQIPVKPEDLE